ncbi:MAG: 6-phosphofructokinase [Gemmatimonadota bacterium]
MTRKIAINTGGGDAPGLNAVIRAAVLSGLNQGWEMYGIRRGYDGLFEDDGIMCLDPSAVSGITHLGGSILGTNSRGNPLQERVEKPDGTVETRDRSDDIVEAFNRLDFDALIAIGGDGSLTIADRLYEKGLPVVGVPKTIDNDLAATQVTFGFHTAVQTAMDAIDKLHSTAEAHQRVMIVELMGRHTGWIALFAGLTGTADVILIPEIPYRIESVVEKIEHRYKVGRSFAIVVIAEGARPVGGEAEYKSSGEKDEKPGTRYGGIGERLADQIRERTEREVRSLVLGHLQRGGEPVAYDRLLALRFGAAAVELIAREEYGCMVALHPPEVEAVPLKEAVSELKRVPVEGDVVRTARAMGISFGD